MGETPENYPRLDFNHLSLGTMVIRAATIPEMIRLLPGADEKPRTPNQIAKIHVQRFINGWKTIAHSSTLVAHYAEDYVVDFGIAPDQEIAGILLENTVYDKGAEWSQRQRQVLHGASRILQFDKAYSLERIRLQGMLGYRVR